MSPSVARYGIATALVIAAVSSAVRTNAVNLEERITAISPAENGRFGRAIVSADFDGDGADDLAISSGPTVGIGGYIGAVDVYFSGGSPPRTLVSSQPQNAPSFGQALASGDVDGDGYGDLVIGSPNATSGSKSGAGEAVVFFGPALTLATILRDPLPQSGAQFGVSVAVGDINADGYEEVVVGAWDSHVGQYNRAGEAFIFSAPALSQVRTLQSPEPQSVGDFGVASAVGDINGDGYGDVVIGSWAADVTPDGDQGKVFLFKGPDLSTHVRLVHSGAGIRLGRALALGDVNGDGRADIIAGAHSGFVVFRHSSDGTFDADALFITDGGADLDSRDTNGDGYADIVVGAPGDDGAATNAGSAWLVLGPHIQTAHALSKPTYAASDLLGTAVAFTSFFADGPRVLVSATGDDLDAPEAGAVLAARIIDPDRDGVLSESDNCPDIANPDQSDSDLSLPNGPNVPGEDPTLPGSAPDPWGDACDPNDDNDAYSDAAEGVYPIAGCPSATAATNPLAMDTDGDHLTDKWECDNGSDPASAASTLLGVGMADDDADHVPDLWERRGYDTSGTSDDSDTDGCHDMVETASLDSNGTVNDIDRLAVARRALRIWASEPQQDYALDMSKNGTVDDADRLFVARAALLPDWLPKTCH